MIPPTKISKSSLFHRVSSRAVLVRAWFDVRPRVSYSRDAAIRAAADAFSKDLDKSIRNLQREMRAHSFQFEPQRGVLKAKKDDRNRETRNLRPIVVAPLKNRIVQRAILNVCQAPDPRVQRRLGALPLTLATPTSVGGLPGRGAGHAIDLITRAIALGARWCVRSDIKKFFQTVPKNNVEAFLRANISDQAFVNLFMSALTTELNNENEIRELISLFPIGDIGIPQGSALSALSANIVLSHFDTELNGRGICMIRYLDDFVILGANKHAVEKAWWAAKKLLSGLGMDCHDPRAGTGKASMGEIASGFDFLSFHIDDKDVYPSKSARSKFLLDLRGTIVNAKNEIVRAPDEPRRAESRYVQSLTLLDSKIRGWGDAFGSTTKSLILAQLDGEIDSMLTDYEKWFAKCTRGRSVQSKRRLVGVALLIDQKVSKNHDRS